MEALRVFNYSPKGAPQPTEVQNWRDTVMVVSKPTGPIPQ